MAPKKGKRGFLGFNDKESEEIRKLRLQKKIEKKSKNMSHLKRLQGEIFDAKSKLEAKLRLADNRAEKEGHKHQVISHYVPTEKNYPNWPAF